MFTTIGETYEIVLYQRKENSAYEYNDFPTLSFYGRPAGQLEKKQYRIQKGVDGNTDSQYIFVSNLPDNVKIGDRVYYLGKYWIIESIGYYFDSNMLVNAKIMSDEYIQKRCPKGIAIH